MATYNSDINEESHRNVLVMKYASVGQYLYVVSDMFGRALSKMLRWFECDIMILVDIDKHWVVTTPSILNYWPFNKAFITTIVAENYHRPSGYQLRA